MSETKKSIIGNLKTGINAVLPLIILIALFSWGIKLVFRLIQPFVVVLAPRAEDQTIFVKLAALFLILFGVIMIGAMLKSQKGRKRWAKIEAKIFRVLPGYTMIKETVLQFLGTKKVPFSQVAIVHTFDNSTRQIAFVTDEHKDGYYTVFVPTGPNPTSGNIYILPERNVKLIDIPVEQAMKTIIACGIGSDNLTKKKRIR